MIVIKKASADHENIPLIHTAEEKLEALSCNYAINDLHMTENVPAFQVFPINPRVYFILSKRTFSTGKPVPDRVSCFM